MTPSGYVRAHLSPVVRMTVASRRRIRAATKRARREGCTLESFCNFMDAVVPDWRKEGAK